MMMETTIRSAALACRPSREDAASRTSSWAKVNITALDCQGHISQLQSPVPCEPGGIGSFAYRVILTLTTAQTEGTSASQFSLDLSSFPIPCTPAVVLGSAPTPGAPLLRIDRASNLPASSGLIPLASVAP